MCDTTDPHLRDDLGLLTQMEASAKQMAELEEQLVHERSQVASLTAKLQREDERRQIAQNELDSTKQAGRRMR